MQPIPRPAPAAAPPRPAPVPERANADRTDPDRARPDPARPSARTAQPPAPAARLVGVVRRYRMGATEVRALDGIDLELPAGALSAVAGPSGSGKSTLLHHLGCLERPDAGRIEVLGADLATLSDGALTALRRARIGFVFQSFSLIPVLTAAENVEYPLILQGVPKPERRARTAEMLEAVGLGSRARHRPGELSGGQRQRVAIARALIKLPDLVIADEPTANLDSRTGAELMEMMARMQQQRGTTFVIASHDPAVSAMAQHRFTLIDGRIAANPIDGRIAANLIDGRIAAKE